MAATLASGFSGAFAANAAPAPTPTPASETGTTRVIGELVTVADGDGGTSESRIRTADGEFVPVPKDAVVNIAPGSTIAVTVGGRRSIDRSGGTTFSPRVDTKTPAPAPTPTPTPSPTPTSTPSPNATVVSSPVTTPVADTIPSIPTQQVSIALVVPAGVSATAYTESDARAQVAAASQYWSEQTGGALRFSVASVSAPMTLATGCSDAFGMWREAATRTGFTAGTDKHLVLVMPKAVTNAGCSYGLASIGSGPRTGGYAYVADSAWPVLAHELGHNLGLNHAERLLCTGGSDVDLAALGGKGCQIQDYGDPWDVMAASAPNNAGSLSTPQAARLGLLPASAVTTVTAGTQTVTLNSVSSFAGTRAVKAVDPRTGVAYYVEYRTRSGRDYLLYQNMVGGVRVLREDTTATGAAKPTLAIDATPTGAKTDLNWGVPATGSFASYGTGVSVRVVGQDATTAQVTVTVG